MEAEIWDRIPLLVSQLRASDHVDERVTDIYEEIVCYMQYYSDHVSFMSKMMRLLEHIEGLVPEIRQGLAMEAWRCWTLSLPQHSITRVN